MLRTTIILLSLVWCTECFSAAPHRHQRQGTGLQSISRSDFLSKTVAAGLVAIAPALPVNAKDVDPALKGTKQDPEYQSCISVCVYECTKPKGEETKLRKECLPECKQKCATTKQQLMIGTPVEQK